jgi:high-affinity nickel permease
MAKHTHCLHHRTRARTAYALQLSDNIFPFQFIHRHAVNADQHIASADAVCSCVIRRHYNQVAVSGLALQQNANVCLQRQASG